MTWFKVDDAFPSHRKVLSIPRGPRRLAAIGGWTLAGAWVAGNSNDGHVPSFVLEDLGISSRAVEDLLTAGLWRQVPDGYLVHDYLDYNPSREQVEKDRAAAADRQKRARDKARASRRDGTVSNAVTHADVTRGVTDTVTVPPTRPDPTRPEETATQSPSAPVAALPDRFDEFWDTYPRRIGKGAAVKAWKTATKKTDPDTIVAAASSFALSSRSSDPKFIPHPSTWLNAERWADERPPLRAVAGSGQPPWKMGDWDV